MEVAVIETETWFCVGSTIVCMNLKCFILIDIIYNAVAYSDWR